MSFLRSLRNLAVLVIFTVAGLSFSPHSMAAQSRCGVVGTPCQSNYQCCIGELCKASTHRCCGYFHRACRTNADCCSNICLRSGCL
jgi:hypothetical protein